MTDTVAFNVIPLKINMGHGMARKISIENCTNELVAIMDADDISLHTRFEKQLKRFMENSDLSVIGGQIAEFNKTPDNISGIRKVPLDHKSICKFMKRRCPFNQMSVMLKKADIIKAGGYKDWFCEEDYYLWLRMMQEKCLFENLPDILVNVRVGEEMSARRGGMKYFLSERRLQQYMLKKHIISVPQYLRNVSLRFGGEVIATNKLRSKLFKFFRAKITEDEKQILAQEERQDINCFTRNREEFPPFSVAMSVYRKDNAKWLDIALDSIINQSVVPNEIVLVIDGPISESLTKTIEKYRVICKQIGIA